MFYKLTLLLSQLMISAMLQAQTGVAINNTGAAPAAAALLDVASTTKGVLLPRMSTGQRKNIQNLQPGLMVFDLDKATFYLYDGEQWRPLAFTTERLLPLIERLPTVDNDNSIELGSDVGIFGTYAVAGARYEANGLMYNQGAVYIYHKENNTWKLHQKLTPADGGKDDHFGSSVAMYNDILAVGSPGSTINGTLNAGAVYVYKRTGSVWNFVKKLVPAETEVYSGYGNDVSVFNGKILVGSPGKTINGQEHAGTAYYYDFINNDWILGKQFTSQAPAAYDELGYAVKLYNNDVVLGQPGRSANGLDAGTVQVFTRNLVTNSWLETTILPLYPQNGIMFGAALDLYKDSLIVGAPKYTEMLNNANYQNAGLFMVIKRTDGVWAYKGTYTGSAPGQYAGDAVAMGDKYHVGSYPGTEGGGTVLVADYGHSNRYRNIEREAGDGFGKSVAISGNEFIIGAPDKNGGKGSVQFGTFE